MTVRERILAIRLLEKQERNPEYTSKVGIQVDMVQRDRSQESQSNHLQNSISNNRLGGKSNG